MTFDYQERRAGIKDICLLDQVFRRHRTSVLGEGGRAFRPGRRERRGVGESFFFTILHNGWAKVFAERAHALCTLTTLSSSRASEARWYPGLDMALRVLLIDDDARLYDLLSSYLDQNGFHVTTAPDGPRGLAALEAGTYDVVLLDLMMPGMDGIEVCRRIRQKSTIPVLMLTARGDETDRVVGLEIGADDYVAKPFSPRELVARIKAVLRRARPEVTGERIVAGDIVIDVPGRTVTKNSESIELTGLEFDLLCALARRPGRVVARDALLSEAGRGDVIVGERTVDVHISHLRQKLGDDPRTPRMIKTVRGVGYVLAKDKP